MKNIAERAQRVVFTGKQSVSLETFDLQVPGPGEICVRTDFSLMSTGTENIVFNRLFDPGTHWDYWVSYPFYPGYATAGVVDSVGEGVSARKPGDRVFHRAGHCSHAVVKESECYLLPDSLPSDEAVWYALARIAFIGAKAAAYQLGDSVLIIGAGPIGQMSVRWAHASGACPIIVVDPVPEREQAARSGGATTYITAPIGSARDLIVAANAGLLPKIVIDTTGNATVFAEALQLAADFGRVVVLGDTGTPGKQMLTSDVIKRGLQIVGAHDGHHPPGWAPDAIPRLFFDMVSDGRISLKGINTHYFKPEHCGEAYATANRDRAKTMGILFDWRR
jgi:2-desacetyl-2-hydroxyethyl bacteriochlorophyllide A dehydrogenase